MQDAIISAIAAIGKNLELGASNQLLWHLPDDFAWFVKHTKGHPVVMGRKTMESLGKPLKNRKNIVISRQPNSILDGFEYAQGIEEAIKMARQDETDEIFIIGGGEIYAQAMKYTQRLYITEVQAAFPEADTHFPKWTGKWKEIFREHHPSDERHDFAFDFVILESQTD